MDRVRGGRRRIAKRFFVGLATAATLSFSTQPADAQYFGRNKVQVDTFDFQVLETDHFDIYYYPAEADAARLVGRMAERWYVELSATLQHTLAGRQPVIFYASHPEFEQTNVIEGMINEGTGGVTEGAQRRVVLPFAASLRETDHVLGHELVHAFQYDMLGRNIEAVPLWVIEGMAEYYSIGTRDAQTAMWLRDAAREDRLPRIQDLDDPRFFPYRFGHAFWAYLAGRFGESAVTRVLHSLGGRQAAGPVGPEAAIEAVTGQRRDDLNNAWHESIRSTFGVTPREENTRETPPAGQQVLGRRSSDAGIDVGPALSPDGSRIAFLSERGRLSIDLYVADAPSGNNVRQLTRTAVDPHFESLQFLASAGSWAPDNRRLAAAVVKNGRAALAIFDADAGRLVQEIPLGTAGEIFSPSWSPDGNRIVFSAQIGGLTDLHVADVASGAIRRLTRDAFADLQPAWSSDGRRIAFVTDRFSTDLDALRFGNYRLGLIDAESGRVEAWGDDLPGDATSPAWGTGDTLFFVSTATGRPELYRQRRGEQPVAAVTTLTGVAGITPVSAALSAARDTGALAFSVFRDGGYEIRFADGGIAAGAPAGRDLALLPPGSRSAGADSPRVASRGTPAPATRLDTRPYRANLSLIDVGQSLGVGTASGDYGTYVSGGISLLFSDVLGNHLVPTTFSVNGRFQDIAAQAGYLNRTRRWNWGVFAERIPLVSGTVRPSVEVINGQQVYVETSTLFRQTASQIGALTAFPFNRSSRIEFSAGVRHIGFDQELERLVFDPFSGVLLDREITDAGPGSSLRLIDTTAAFIRDTAAFGAVSPILGQRLRAEITPTWGDLQIVEGTVDLRQYAMPIRPVTFAARLLHIGRYGGDAEDDRLFPLFLGYPSLLRGYDANSFTTEDCTPTALDPCPELNRLSGSRVALVNAEVRIPVGGLFTGDLDYGPVPAELFGFFDAGIAWDRAAGLVPESDRTWSRSVGVGARVNLFGFAIGEFNLARPLDRPRRQWDFVFNLRPGF